MEEVVQVEDTSLEDNVPQLETLEADVATEEPEPQEDESDQSADSPQSDQIQQFEMVETPDTQPENHAASSSGSSFINVPSSGSSFVNVPSCSEVDSYQDISTVSSPDTTPSSPNRSHASTPTGILDEDQDGDEDVLEPEVPGTKWQSQS